MAGKIFINYRRGDDPGNTGRLFDHLQEAFRPEQLFMDVESIEPGLDFVKVLEDQVAQCDIVLTVIGHNWIEARDEAGGRRLDNPKDFVRIEIESALAQGKRVIPVLVGQGRMPRAHELPESIKPLARRQAVRLTHERFRADVQGLIEALKKALDKVEDARLRPTSRGVSRRALLIGGAVAAVIAALGLVALPTAVREDSVASAGQLTVGAPDALTFEGPQGGPFTPDRSVFTLKATGPALHWSVDGAVPAWLSVSPNEGDLGANSAAEVVVALATTAQSATRGRYVGHLIFRNHSDNITVAQAIKLVVREPTPLPLAREQTLKSGDTFKECANCPEVVVVPAGSFTMGSPGSEAWRDDNESPQHTVTFANAFGVTKFSITRGQFAAFVGDAGYKAEGGCLVRKGPRWEPQADVSWRSPAFDQDDTHPVVCVSWDDAKAFVAWLSQKTRKPYRLMSEAEFEYAVRGGTAKRFFFGEDEKDFCRYGNGWDETANKGHPQWTALPCSDGYIYTSPVGRFSPNKFGLYDMLGNAWQWVEDCYHGTYDGAPSDGSAWTSPTCSVRVVRGGSWYSSAGRLRSASRLGYPTRGRQQVGFRVARTLAP